MRAGSPSKAGGGGEKKCGVKVPEPLEEHLLFLSVTLTCSAAVRTHDGGNNIKS